MGVVFDEVKRQATLQARGLDFRDAATIWGGPTLTVPDERRDYSEDRFVT